MALTQEQLMAIFGSGNIASGLGGLGNPGKNPADAAMPYLDQISDKGGKPLQPYMDYGEKSLPVLQNQYESLINGPGKKLNSIGEDFQQSPGFKFALEQALGAANRSSAAGGMAGSPANQQESMTLATNLANQDYYNWLGGATGLYGKGLQGEEGMADRGANAGKSMSDLIAQQLSQQANLAYQGEKQKNESSSANWGSIFGGIASALPYIAGIL